MSDLYAARGPAQVRALNDAFRLRFSGGRVVVTAGIAALPDDTRAAVLAAVRASDAFTPDDDPHGEQDFGAVTVAGLRVFWKIDTRGRAVVSGSPGFADSAVTTRVLTIMLAEEY